MKIILTWRNIERLVDMESVVRFWAEQKYTMARIVGSDKEWFVKECGKKGGQRASLSGMLELSEQSDAEFLLTRENHLVK